MNTEITRKENYILNKDGKKIRALKVELLATSEQVINMNLISEIYLTFLKDLFNFK